MKGKTMDCDTARIIETSAFTKDPEQLEENISLFEITNYCDIVEIFIMIYSLFISAANADGR